MTKPTINPGCVLCLDAFLDACYSVMEQLTDEGKHDISDALGRVTVELKKNLEELTNEKLVSIWSAPVKP